MVTFEYVENFAVVELPRTWSYGVWGIDLFAMFELCIPVWHIHQ